MPLSDIRAGVVIGQLIAALICLMSCSKAPVSDATPETITTSEEQKAGRPSLALERVVVPLPLTNGMSTLIGFERSAPPPWQVGNYLTIGSWKILNMNSENFFEITRHLKMSSVELHVLHTGPVHGIVHPEHKIISDEGYAVVTDARIPRDWFLSEPGNNTGWGNSRIDPKTARELKAACPGNFRASE